MPEKVSDFFVSLFILKCYRHIFFSGSGSFTLSHTSCQLVRTLLLLDLLPQLSGGWLLMYISVLST